MFDVSERVEIGPQLMAADPRSRLDLQDVLSREVEALVQPAPDGSLSHAKKAPHRRLRANLLDGGAQRGGRRFGDSIRVHGGS